MSVREPHLVLACCGGGRGGGGGRGATVMGLEDVSLHRSRIPRDPHGITARIYARFAIASFSPTIISSSW